MILIFLLFNLVSALADQKVCQTAECVQLAARYLNNMNVDVNPCDDFYEYACGRFNSENLIAEDAKKVTPSSQILKKFEENLQKFLKSPLKKNASKSRKFIKTFYDSCLKSQVDGYNLSAAELRETIMREVAGTLDFLKISWEQVVGNIALHGVFPIIDVTPEVYRRNSSKHILTFSSGNVYFTEWNNDNKTYNYIMYYKTFHHYIYGFMPDYVHDAILDLEANLTEILPEKREEHQEIMNIVTYGELKKTYTNIKFDDFFTDEIRKLIGNISDSTEVNVRYPKFYEDLNNYIKTVDKDIIKKYARWRMMQNYDRYLPKIFREAIWKYKNISSELISKRCLDLVVTKLHIPLALEFVENIMSSERNATIKTIKKVTEDLLDATQEKLNNSDWFEMKTKEGAMKKIENMIVHLGYPDEGFNQNDVMKSYENITLSSDNTFENLMSIRKVYQKSIFLKMQKKPSIQWEDSQILDATALAYPEINELAIPILILSFPFFVESAPFSTHFGAIGSIIAHEISHGYDVSGAKYDEFGNLKNWWTPEDLKKFEKHKKCLVDQYGRQVEPLTKLKIDGKYTLRENMADNIGLQIAFEAFEKRLVENKNKKKKKVENLPGLQNIPDKKIFFIAFANAYCENWKLDGMRESVKYSSHAPHKIRVNVPLQNFEKFSEVFKCGNSTKMNPIDKCAFW
ncbi:unnamed protein product [Caenorhabditis angaria]|uniref:Peptidase M13 C-terminal domain-containing protein n=1 Tax=Caenorhabditis angaria TaxID=860376 RepID=A0A9P1IDS7_9PELO|nr:unnamed protein product [Caenorhabditis angaria]